jgi:hypothetical protein
MQMPGEAHERETGTGPESYPILVRSFEPAADLDERLKLIFTVSLPPLEELSAQGPRLTRSTTRMTGDVAEPPLGIGFGDRCGESEGSSGVFEAGDAWRLNRRDCRENGFPSAIPPQGSLNANPPW